MTTPSRGFWDAASESEVGIPAAALGAENGEVGVLAGTPGDPQTRVLLVSTGTGLGTHETTVDEIPGPRTGKTASADDVLCTSGSRASTVLLQVL